ncbi:hypothetical protein LOZ67_005457 [Ophidiomyces ophidiicola]|nr:hypothetical protein LOZ67_005457 [Ophidiomyces ophidiicola]
MNPPPDLLPSAMPPPPPPPPPPPNNPVHATLPDNTAAAAQPKQPRKGPSTRRALSCLPCRRHKLKCDRHVPCHSCTRYRREDLCRKHPAPSSLLDGMRGAPKGPPNNIAAVADLSAAAAYPPAAAATTTTTTTTAAALHPSQPAAAPLRHPPDALLAAAALTVRDTVASVPPHHLASLTQHLAGTSLLPASLPFLAAAGQSPVRHAEVAAFWKTQLIAFLPTKRQCDLLVTYYLEHLNWVYHVVHVPSYLDEYAAFWDTKVHDVNLIWLALLYAIISSSAIYLPLRVAKTAGFAESSIRNRAHMFYSASRQALHAGNFESRPTLVGIETFLVTQSYWLATKNVEALNS